MALTLEVAAHAITAILGTWLGLRVFTRARGAAGAPVFGLLSLLLVVWSVAIIGQRLGANTALHPLLNAIEDLGAFLLPAVTAHLGISVALEGRTSRLALAVLVPAYVLGAGAAIQAAVDPGHPILPAPPHFEPFGIPGELLGWAFIAIRAGVFAAGIGWLVSALRHANGDLARRRQLQVMLATLSLGIAGGMARILPEGIGGPPWVGISLIAMAAMLAVYAVFAQRLFSGAELTARAFRIALLAGVAVVAYVAALVGLDRAVASTLGIELPIVIALALVATIALFEPAAELVRRRVAGTDDGQVALDRLLRAVGDDLLADGGAGSPLEPALARLVRTFKLEAAAVLDADGRPRLMRGDHNAVDRLPTRFRFEDGHLAFGHKRSGLPLTPGEVDILRLATSYLDAAVRLRARQDAQASALAELSLEGDVVERHEAALSEALAAHRPPQKGLRVYALGPLRAEVDGEPIRRWGGEKAGARQAEAVFAFLFDRGERGAGKDEIVEVVWPDVDLERTDMAFHRTLLGLRSALSPGRSARAGGPILFSNDRYKLAPAVVTWSDVDAFEGLLASARETPDEADRVRLLESARALYRADAFDDCPFYGDSVYVEERRQELRERYVDLLIDLGTEYAARGDRSGASDALRRAASLTERELPVIDEVLRRLDAPARHPARDITSQAAAPTF